MTRKATWPEVVLYEDAIRQFPKKGRPTRLCAAPPEHWRHCWVAERRQQVVTAECSSCCHPPPQAGAGAALHGHCRLPRMGLGGVGTGEQRAWLLLAACTGSYKDHQHQEGLVAFRQLLHLGVQNELYEPSPTHPAPPPHHTPTHSPHQHANVRSSECDG